MLKPALKSSLALAAVIALTASASAGDYYRGDDRYAAPPPAPAARYYGPVNNYYGPVTVYAAPDGGSYPAPAANYPAYDPGYASAPPCDANCYGAGYDWSHGYGYGYGYGGSTAYPAYGYAYGYPPSNEGQRLDPWAGYNGGFGNGYW